MPPRVEVVLQVTHVIDVEADEGDAIWCIGVVDLPSLNQEAPSRKPFERGQCLRSIRRIRDKSGDHAPLTQKQLERIHRLGTRSSLPASVARGCLRRRATPGRYDPSGGRSVWDGGESFEMIPGNSDHFSDVRTCHVRVDVFLGLPFLGGHKRAGHRIRSKQLVGDAAMIAPARGREGLQGRFDDRLRSFCSAVITATTSIFGMEHPIPADLSGGVRHGLRRLESSPG